MGRLFIARQGAFFAYARRRKHEQEGKFLYTKRFAEAFPHRNIVKRGPEERVAGAGGTRCEGQRNTLRGPEEHVAFRRASTRIGKAFISSRIKLRPNSARSTVRQRDSAGAAGAENAFVFLYIYGSTLPLGLKKRKHAFGGLGEKSYLCSVVTTTRTHKGLTWI